LVAAGFSLRLFAQLKSCGYRNLFGQVETCVLPYFVRNLKVAATMFLLVDNFPPPARRTFPFIYKVLV